MLTRFSMMILALAALTGLAGCSAFPVYKTKITPTGNGLAEKRFLPLGIAIGMTAKDQAWAEEQAVIADMLDARCKKHFEHVNLALEPKLTTSEQYRLNIRVDQCSRGESVKPMAALSEYFGVLGHHTWVKLRLHAALVDSKGTELWGQDYDCTKEMYWNARMQDDLDIPHKISYEAAVNDIMDTMVPKLIDSIVQREEKQP